MKFLNKMVRKILSNEIKEFETMKERQKEMLKEEIRKFDFKIKQEEERYKAEKRIVDAFNGDFKDWS